MEDWKEFRKIPVTTLEQRIDEYSQTKSMRIYHKDITVENITRIMHQPRYKIRFMHAIDAYCKKSERNTDDVMNEIIDFLSSEHPPDAVRELVDMLIISRIMPLEYLVHHVLNSGYGSSYNHFLSNVINDFDFPSVKQAMIQDLIYSGSVHEQMIPLINHLPTLRFSQDECTYIMSKYTEMNYDTETPEQFAVLKLVIDRTIITDRNAIADKIRVANDSSFQTPYYKGDYLKTHLLNYLGYQ